MKWANPRAWLIVAGLSATTALSATALAEGSEARLMAALEEKVGRVNTLRKTEAPTRERPTSSNAFRLAGLATGLALAAFAAAWVVKRRKESGLVEDGGPDLAIKESVWIGRGQRLLLVSVQGQPVLVGATSQGMFGLGNLAPAGGAPEPSEPLPFKSPETSNKHDAFSRYVERSLDETPRTEREKKRRLLSRLNAL
jgi:flagellar biogenesis protein FliO